MSINKITANTASVSSALELNEIAHDEKNIRPNADGIAKKSFAGKTVSLIGSAIKSGLSIAIKGSLKIAKFTTIAAFNVGKALVRAINTAGESAKSSIANKSEGQASPKPLQNRKSTTIKDVPETQKNLASAIRQSKETNTQQKVAEKDRLEIANLERRAKALKQDTPSISKKPNQDYTNFEKSSSTLSANANLNTQDKKDIAELEKRLRNLKQS